MKPAALISAALALCLAVCAGCHRQNTRTSVIRVPDLTTDAAAEKIIHALSPYQEYELVLEVVPNVPDRSVNVVYDGLVVSLKNIEYLIARAGFAANDTPALPELQATPDTDTP
jgi:hypothetical protein